MAFFSVQTSAQDHEINQIADQYFPGKEAKLPGPEFNRLTRTQIDNTARSILPGLNIPSVKKYMPSDGLQNNYEYPSNLRFTPANTGQYKEWTDKVAELTEHYKGVLNCENEGYSDACLRRESDRYIKLTRRGDQASESQLKLYSDFVVEAYKKFGIGATRADLVKASLLSPNFLFQGIGAFVGDIDKNGKLPPAQIAQNLAYTLTDFPPHIFTAQGDSVEKTKSAILASNETREKLLRFFKAWLDIPHGESDLSPAEEFNISRHEFPEFNDTYAKNLVSSLDRFLREKLGQPNPTLRDITQSVLNPNSESSSEPKRLGVFSHPAVITAHSGPTDIRPMHRGSVWAKKFLCVEMQPPPGGEDIKPPEPSKTNTLRETYEAFTKSPKCTGCHNALNPLGFFLGNYDALGRWKTTDNGKPIDARMKLDFLDEGPVRTNHPNESLTAITNSMMFKQCFVRQLFRFYMGRDETPSDHPLLRKMFIEFTRNDKQDLLRLLDIMTGSETFSHRNPQVRSGEPATVAK